MRSQISRACLSATAGLAALLTAASANANVITGAVYSVPEANANLANPGSIVGAPIITFSVNTPLNFQNGGTYTDGEFLASGGATILTGAANLGTLMDDGTNGTLIDFKGTVSVTNGQTFAAGHDDGLTLIIGGLNVISAPGPTSFGVTMVTYTGPTGNLPFELVYGECCGSPGLLSIDLPFSVPEPATLTVLGVGLTALGLVRRKRSA